MTSTSHFQISPDYYSSAALCKEAKAVKEKDKIGTNPRYTKFKQTHFTAGDEEQFQQYRDSTNGELCPDEISLEGNRFEQQPTLQWDKYKDLPATAVINTFRYIFNKFKKGIFVKIKDGKLAVFLPFSKNKFINEWADKIQIPRLNEDLRKIYKFKRYWNKNHNKWAYSKDRETGKRTEYKTDLEIFFNYVNEQQGPNKWGGRHNFQPDSINKNISAWYANNCILRIESPINESDSNVATMKNLLEELCEKRQVPDIEFFMNRRDFPILTKNGTEAYYNLWERETQPLVSHNYEKYSPILSMSVTDRYADIPSPTHEDWARVQSQENKLFLPNCSSYTDIFDTPWRHKKPTAVFRGGSTGCGVTIDTNMRLKVAHISETTLSDKNGIPLLDAGITNWNARVRKLVGNPFLQTIDISTMPPLVPTLNRVEQSKYKYIINIDGHVSAFRLSLELSMGSVVLLVNSPWKMWYSDMLIPGTHYIPIKSDLSDLIEQIQWCRSNDAQCQQIAENAKMFYETYLQKDGILDYMQKTLVNLKKQNGAYFYNIVSPLDIQIQKEYRGLSLDYPDTEKTVSDISTIPPSFRNNSLLQGIHWIINMINEKHYFEDIAQQREQIASNKTGIVRKFILSNFPLAVKTTRDPVKLKENIHEAFIGTKATNELLKHIPNFAYIFGLYEKDNSYNVITEYIQGQSFSDYIKRDFNFREYLLIIAQLCLALQVAQNHCAFTHYDLTPWNIILQRLPTPIKIDYVLEHDRIVRVTTHIIPVIIDYGKSHVVYDNMHYGFINMYKTSTAQDILTLLIKSISDIPSRAYSNSLLILANFMSGTKFRQQTFKNQEDLRKFIYKNETYNDLISSNKYELEERTPMDLLNYIRRNLSEYPLQLSLVDTYKPFMDRGNARQVFDYILSPTINEKVNSFTDVFFRCENCDIPVFNNLFLNYHSAQKLYDNLVSVKSDMINFLEQTNISTEYFEKIADNTMAIIAGKYDSIIQDMKKEDIVYNIPDEFYKFKPSPYTEETFLLPDTVSNLLETDTYKNLSHYKHIIEYILINQGRYQMNDEDREYYLRNFANLLNISGLTMQNNTANVKTLRETAYDLYTINLENLNVNCRTVELYREKLEDIINKTQN